MEPRSGEKEMNWCKREPGERERPATRAMKDAAGNQINKQKDGTGKHMPSRREGPLKRHEE